MNSAIASTTLRALSVAATNIPECNEDMSQWPESDLATCKALNLTGAQTLTYRYVFEFSQLDYIKMCSSDACMSLESRMKSANPTECISDYTANTPIYLYKRLLNPLDSVCDQLKAGIIVDPVATAAPVTTPKATTTTTTQPQTSTSTPSTSISTRSPTTTTPTPHHSSASEDGASSSSTQSAQPKTASPTPNQTTTVPLSSPSAGSAGSTSSSGHTPSVAENAPVPGQNASATASKSSSTELTIAIGVGAAVIFIVAVLLVVRSRQQSVRRRKKLNDEPSTNTTTDTEEGVSSTSGTQDGFLPLLQRLLNWKINSRELVDIKLLGSGTHGAVCLVTLDGSRQLASKRLVADQITKQRLNAFIAEAQLVATLKHPSIVPFTGVSWTTVADFQVLFEYMPNGDLRTHLDRTKPLQPETWTREKMKMALQIAEGLVYVHSFNPPIVHRDLKARNILLDGEMDAKMSDFGVSRSHSEQGTMTTGVGTSRWLAPEVIMGGGKYTEQCDIYSFGVLLTEIDTHDLPFADKKCSEIALLHQVATAGLRPRTTLVCDPQIKELIEACLSEDPRDRPNALELAYRLRKLLKS